MAGTLPRQRTTNCFLCYHYRPGVLDFQGKCSAKAITANGAVDGGATNGELMFPDILRPADTFCGDFRKWNGEARQEGNCYPVPES